MNENPVLTLTLPKENSPTMLCKHNHLNENYMSLG